MPSRKGDRHAPHGSPHVLGATGRALRGKQTDQEPVAPAAALQRSRPRRLGVGGTSPARAAQASGAASRRPAHRLDRVTYTVSTVRTHKGATPASVSGAGVAFCFLWNCHKRTATRPEPSRAAQGRTSDLRGPSPGCWPWLRGAREALAPRLEKNSLLPLEDEIPKPAPRRGQREGFG